MRARPTVAWLCQLARDARCHQPVGQPSPHFCCRLRFTLRHRPGLLTTHPTGTADTSIKGKFVVPANL
jgi:hypothetical protein